MVEGTTISVTVEGEEIELIGDTEVTLRDVNPDFSNIEDLTEYRFNVKDADADNNEDSPVIITIEVDGPNGYAKKVIEGRKAKGI
jgi:DNA-directed RNA polymerase alpha subunit